MTIRVTAFFDCNRAAWRIEDVKTRLVWALPEAKSIRAHAGPVQIARTGTKNARKHSQRLLDQEYEWIPCSSPGLEESWFWGPGGLGFCRWKETCEVNTTCWWRAFIRSKPLRNAYVKAFHRIASVFGGTTLIVFPTGSKAKDLHWEGASIDQAMDALEQEWGESQPSIDKVSTELQHRAEDETPRIWFIEDVKHA